MKRGTDTWWWDEDVQESIQIKKLAKRTLDKDNNEEKKVLRMANEREKNAKYIYQSKVIKYEEGRERECWWRI